MLFNAAILSSLIALVAASPASLVERGTCPVQQCAPTPGLNFCDITTSCTSTGGISTGGGVAPDYCACRAGYKANPNLYPASDPSVQMRLPWPSQEGRVFVRPGVPCDTLCNDWQLGAAGCKEVPVQTGCVS